MSRSFVLPITLCMILSSISSFFIFFRLTVHAEIPTIRDGELGALYYGQRRSGDFFDFLRCGPDRVLLGLFDVAGKLEQARPVMVAMQKKLRILASELLED